MSAAVADAVRPVMRPMRVEDLDAVMVVERRAYPWPWSIGIFRDCLFAGYPAWVLVEGGAFIGHGVLSVRSSASGALYRFQGHGASLVIDPRDALLLGRLSDVHVG